MDNNITSKDISRDEQVAQQTQQAEPEVQRPDQSNPTVPQTVPETPVPPKSRMHKLHHFKRKNPVTIACTGFLLLVLLGCGALSAGYYYYMTNIQPSLTSFRRPVSRDRNGSSPMQPANASSITGRSWNILLMGSDNDSKFAFPQVLTQVMMLVHIDTVKNTVSMVSIPRDSWVAVPEVGGMHKIGRAFLLGAQRDNSFEGGVRLARLTVEQDYGIAIDRYAWIGLDGFAKAIDTLGGVDIDITHPVVDDTYPHDVGASSDPNNPYAYTRLYLAPGPQHLTGEQALEYVRTRHSDQIGDIGRTHRQQQVLKALKPKLILSSVMGNITQLLKTLDQKFYTDLSEQEMLALANYGRTLSSDTVQHVTLGPGQDEQDYGDHASVYDPALGAYQDVIIPYCDNIQPVINRIFGLGNVHSCSVTG